MKPITLPLLSAALLVALCCGDPQKPPGEPNSGASHAELMREFSHANVEIK